MADIIPFKKPGTTERKGNTLCKRGYHKWRALPGTPFDVKSGRLLTRFRCERCGAERTQGT